MTYEDGQTNLANDHIQYEDGQRRWPDNPDMAKLDSPLQANNLRSHLPEDGQLAQSKKPTKHQRKLEARRKRDHRNFMARTSDCYNNLRKRVGRKLPFDLRTLREIVSVALLDNCRLCSVDLTIRNFSLDHKTPLSRGGKNDTTNLEVVCKNCNMRKGQLTWPEYAELLVCLARWDPKPRNDVLTRLKAGGGRFHRK